MATVRPDLSSVLWDVDPLDVDEQRHARFLIRRILAEGRPEQVAWMLARYGRPLVLETLRTDRALTRRVSGAWLNLLGES
jgi:hypothetical protein